MLFQEKAVIQFSSQVTYESNTFLTLVNVEYFYLFLFLLFWYMRKEVSFHFWFCSCSHVCIFDIEIWASFYFIFSYFDFFICKLVYSCHLLIRLLDCLPLNLFWVILYYRHKSMSSYTWWYISKLIIYLFDSVGYCFAMHSSYLFLLASFSWTTISLFPMLHHCLQLLKTISMVWGRRLTLFSNHSTQIAKSVNITH